MSAAGKAVWYIETHAEQPLALADIATAVGLSPFHLSRLFQARTGTSVVRYLRGRRLTTRAQLANGACDILQVAIGAGYTTHAAFTRAFSEQFGQTPERVRQQGTDGLALVQAIRVDEAPAACAEAPQLLDTPAFQLAGIGMRHTRNSGGAIPGQWAQLTGNGRRRPRSVLGCAATTTTTAASTISPRCRLVHLALYPRTGSAWMCPHDATWWPGTAGTSRPSARPGSGCWITTAQRRPQPGRRAGPGALRRPVQRAHWQRRRGDLAAGRRRPLLTWS